MEAIQQLVFALFGFWFFEIKVHAALYVRRLRAANKNTAEKRRKLMAWVLSWEEKYTCVRERQRRQRFRMLLLLSKQRRRPVIWALRRANKWWDVTVPGFTHTQWVHNFRMSEETFLYLCAKLRPAMEKQTTNFRACLLVRKRVAIALWKLATNSEYRSIGHLYGVSKSSVCRCVEDFCKAVCTLLAPEIIHFPDWQKLKADNGRLTPEQQTYNKKTSRAWVVVENAFGRLKGRWRCLMKRNDSDIALVKSMVLTCCALHNL
ncbi:Hypothetical predicted protein [Pelobates cultripes]|uniref:DDE Tnp4 domain-containing protein n=1 Tax=Pelobates cultripes TaxID=61616 RepID=A0AAD1WRB3_PELCU|nr:Hypothetical predicted protein [Pelobates cultripes]